MGSRQEMIPGDSNEMADQELPPIVPNLDKRTSSIHPSNHRMQIH